MPVEPNQRKKPFLILSTTPTKQEAIRLAQGLLNKKIVACVNVVYPATSFFYWQGRKEKAREALLIIKTVASHFRKVENFIRAHHSYEVPEVIGWSLEAGNAAYVEWLRNSVV